MESQYLLRSTWHTIHLLCMRLLGLVIILVNPLQVSYKQGMHEVLAPLVFVLAREMLATDTSCLWLSISQLLSLHHTIICSQTQSHLPPPPPAAFAVQFNSGYVEHDAHTLFTIIMSTLAPWYISIQRQRVCSSSFACIPRLIAVMVPCHSC